KKEKDKEAAEETQQLPALAVAQQLKKIKAELKEKKTSAPKPYDDSTLLTAMKNAGQDLDDEDLAAYMKQRGLGTPATRAAIIERLLQTGYIERQKKSLIPTEKGRALIEQVHSDLKDVKLTASWEQRLADMQDGKLSISIFDGDIASFVTGLLPQLASENQSVYSPREGDIGPCPQCSVGSVRFTPKGAGCSRWKDGCNFSIWREQYGKELKDSHITDLVKERRTKLIKGFKKKDGNGTYEAHLALNDDFKVRLSFANETNTEALTCPQCSTGQVRPNSKGVGCSRWREGCTFFIWRQQFGKDLTDEQINALVKEKRTEVIKGFQKKSGTGTYDARLVLNELFKVRLEFDNGPAAAPAGAAATAATAARTSAAKSAPPSSETV
ncbi:MAG TPA: topoisomerase C-terminal repeat-containing protein, partial [Chroococcales cyanobacterium]